VILGRYKDKTGDDELILNIVQQHTTEQVPWQKEYAELDEGYAFLGGEQYTGEEKSWWELQRRASRVYNHYLPIYNTVLGDFLTNDQRVRIFPLPGGAIQTAGALEKLLTQINDDNDSKYVFGFWGLSGLIKRGFVYPRFSDERYPDGSVVFGPMDNYEVGFDSRSKDYYLDDGWYMWRGRWETYDDILLRAPKERRDNIRSFLDDKMHNGFWDGIEDQRISKVLSNTQYVNEKEGKYFVLEWHYKEYEDCVVALDPATGGTQVLDFNGDGKVVEKKFAVYKMQHPGAVIIERKMKKKKICEIIPGMMTVLDRRYADLQDETFDFIPFSAYPYARKAIDYFGIHRNAKDPQVGFNEWENQSEQIVKRIANPGALFKGQYILNKDVALAFGDQPGVNIEIDGNTNLPVSDIYRLKDAPQYPFASNDQALRKLDFLQKVTGVTPNLGGTSETRDENASLFAQRVSQAKQSLQTIYHSWARSKRRMYDKVVSLIQENYTTQKVFYVTQKNQANGNVNPEELIINQQVAGQIVNDMSVGRYRVVAEEMDASQSAKAIRFTERLMIAEKVQQLYGAAVPIEWLLGESVDLGDMADVIRSVQEQTQANMQMQQQANALQTTGAIQQLAQSQMAIRDQGVDVAQNQGQPGQRRQGS
jgi:hypothetical protein